MYTPDGQHKLVRPLALEEFFSCHIKMFCLVKKKKKKKFSLTKNKSINEWASIFFPFACLQGN